MNKDWKEEFDTQFRVGYKWVDDEFVDISKWGEIKSFIESLLKSKQEEIEEAIKEKKEKYHCICTNGSCISHGYNYALEDLKPIINNILKP